MTPSQPVPITLNPETIDAIAERAARRTVDLLRESGGATPAPQLVDPATLAQVLGVSRDCVYAHAAELGGERIGDGPRGRLRFNLDRALEAWTSRSESKGSECLESPAVTTGSARRRQQHMGSSPDLLPIRGAESTPGAPQERS